MSPTRRNLIDDLALRGRALRHQLRRRLQRRWGQHAFLQICFPCVVLKQRALRLCNNIVFEGPKYTGFETSWRKLNFGTPPDLSLFESDAEWRRRRIWSYSGGLLRFALSLSLSANTAGNVPSEVSSAFSDTAFSTERRNSVKEVSCQIQVYNDDPNTVLASIFLYPK